MTELGTNLIFSWWGQRVHKHKWGADTDDTNIHYSSAPHKAYTGAETGNE